jgi:hypothetical protein
MWLPRLTTLCLHAILVLKFIKMDAKKACQSLSLSRSVNLVLLTFPVWLQLGVRATLRSFLVDLFAPKIKLRARERERNRINLIFDTVSTSDGAQNSAGLT